MTEGEWIVQVEIVTGGNAFTLYHALNLLVQSGTDDWKLDDFDGFLFGCYVKRDRAIVTYTVIASNNEEAILEAQEDVLNEFDAARAHLDWEDTDWEHEPWLPEFSIKSLGPFLPLSG